MIAHQSRFFSQVIARLNRLRELCAMENDRVDLLREPTSARSSSRKDGREGSHADTADVDALAQASLLDRALVPFPHSFALLTAPPAAAAAADTRGRTAIRVEQSEARHFWRGRYHNQRPFFSATRRGRAQ